MLIHVEVGQVANMQSHTLTSPMGSSKNRLNQMPSKKKMLLLSTVKAALPAHSGKSRGTNVPQLPDSPPIGTLFMTPK